MRLQRQWWSVLVAVVLGGLVGVTAVAAAGEKFLPILGVREGGQRFMMIPRGDGFIAYLTLLNERDGGINGVTLVWEECETVYDATRTVGCYERLKTKGPTEAAALQPLCAPSASRPGRPSRKPPRSAFPAARPWGRTRPARSRI